MEEQLYKNELQQLKDFAEKEQYVPLTKILEVFPNSSDEFLDDVVKYLENEGIEITREIEQTDDDELLMENVNEDLDGFAEEIEIDEDLEELTSVAESEIRISDFDSFSTSAHQTDDLVKLYLSEIGQIDLLTITQESEYARTVQEGLAAKEKIENSQKLGKEISPEELKQLNFLIEKGDEARDILIESNLRLVVYIARKYMGRGLPLIDLIQEGNAGLAKAVYKFDPTRGWKFSTYSTWWIRQSITRAIADQGRTIRIPVHMVETINRLMRYTRKLTQEKSREPTPEELAAEMKCSVEKVLMIQKIAQEPASLDATVGDEEDTNLGDFVPDTTMKNPLEYTENQIYREEIESVLQTLTPREEKVIRLRFGLDDNHARTLEEVGEEFGVTRERIRQIQGKAIRRLRNPVRLNRLRQARVQSDR